MTAVWTRAERDAALALLPDASKWCQCKAVDEQRVCARHAIHLLSLSICLWRELALADAFRDHLDSRSITSWNDAPERTFADVRRAFETLPVVEDEHADA